MSKDESIISFGELIRQDFSLDRDDLSQKWDDIQTAMKIHGGIHILDSTIRVSQRRARKTAVFVELVEGEFAGEWLFLNTKWALYALSSAEVIEALRVFNEFDYLISIHDAKWH